jgi:hypothetical protein
MKFNVSRGYVRKSIEVDYHPNCVLAPVPKPLRSKAVGCAGRENISLAATVCRVWLIKKWRDKPAI